MNSKEIQFTMKQIYLRSKTWRSYDARCKKFIGKLDSAEQVEANNYRFDRETWREMHKAGA